MNLFEHALVIKERQAMINITRQIQSDLTQSGIKDGIAIVYCPHTTAGITINENADPDVTIDMIYSLEKVFPTNDRLYRHFEGNTHAHLKSSTMGPSQTIIIHNGKLLLGTWQGIYFCEYDGPRNRTYYVKIVNG